MKINKSLTRLTSLSKVYTHTHTPINTGGHAAGNNLCDVVGDNFLHQFIIGPTHINGNKLDLLLSNCAEIVENVTTFTPGQVFPTEHHAVEFSIKTKFKRSEPVPRKVFDFNRGNFDELRSSLLRILPDFTMSTDSIDDCWLKWKKLFLDAVGKFVPKDHERQKMSALD